MTSIYFTLAAILLYLLSDKLLDRLERRAGRRFENRSLIFFGLLLASSLVAFSLIRRFAGAE